LNFKPLNFDLKLKVLPEIETESFKAVLYRVTNLKLKTLKFNLNLKLKVLPEIET
jgi:hypothetical protein